MSWRITDKTPTQTKYRAWKNYLGDYVIDEVRIVKESEHFVFLQSGDKGGVRRAAKVKGFDCYFDTPQQAVHYLMDLLKARRSKALRELQKVDDQIEKLQTKE